MIDVVINIIEIGESHAVENADDVNGYVRDFEFFRGRFSMDMSVILSFSASDFQCTSWTMFHCLI